MGIPPNHSRKPFKNKNQEGAFELPRVTREEAMNERFCSLIVFGPGAPRMFKLHLSRGAIAVLVVAFLLSFLIAVLMGYTYPASHVNEVHRAELEAENRALKVEASNATLGIQKLDEKLAELEAKSKRINELVAP
jgi:hypothetical protein